MQIFINARSYNDVNSEIARDANVLARLLTTYQSTVPRSALEDNAERVPKSSGTPEMTDGSSADETEGARVKGAAAGDVADVTRAAVSAMRMQAKAKPGMMEMLDDVDVDEEGTGVRVTAFVPQAMLAEMHSEAGIHHDAAQR